MVFRTDGVLFAYQKKTGSCISNPLLFVQLGNSPLSRAGPVVACPVAHVEASRMKAQSPVPGIDTNSINLAQYINAAVLMKLLPTLSAAQI